MARIVKRIRIFDIEINMFFIKAKLNDQTLQQIQKIVVKLMNNWDEPPLKYGLFQKGRQSYFFFGKEQVFPSICF